MKDNNKDIYNKERFAKEWDDIDQIVNEEYGGHYVVPGRPSKEDTKAISDYIQKLRRERENGAKSK